MRTTENFSVTFPTTMLKEATRLAKQENRTMSELLREAFRKYQRLQQWDEINAYGRARAKEMGITEKDVIPLIQEFRSEQRQKKTKASKK